MCCLKQTGEGPLSHGICEQGPYAMFQGEPVGECEYIFALWLEFGITTPLHRFRNILLSEDEDGYS